MGPGPITHNSMTSRDKKTPWPPHSPLDAAAEAQAGLKRCAGASSNTAASDLSAGPVFWGKVAGSPWWPCRTLAPDQQLHGDGHRGEALMEFIDSSKDTTVPPGCILHPTMWPWSRGC